MEVARIDFNRIPMFVGDQITPSDLAQLYPYLAAPLDQEGIQKTESSVTKKGYDTTNWGYQYYLQRLNDVLGPAHWRILDGVVYEQQVQRGQYHDWEVGMSTTLEIGSYVDGDWKVIATRTNFGVHTARNKGDALKGALTNALKKTIAMLGPGWQAYAGQLDDDLYDEEGAAMGYFKNLRNAQEAAAAAAAAANQRRAARGAGRTAGASQPQAKAGTGQQDAPKQGAPKPAANQPAPNQGATSNAAPPANEQPQSEAPAQQGPAQQASEETFQASFTVASKPHAGLNSQRQPYVMVTGKDAEGNTARIVAMDAQRDVLMQVKVGATLDGTFKVIPGKNNTTLFQWVA